ncbi:ATP-binding protein [Streptomyces montanisoli]|uniref:ATP-binding protein n=1 Tax=Streptomyces montanisoli TaxID=2798581 RepID=A0A940MEN3_9ACTN|nr:ATP-binding protein [Streptomyces montanisoli]MBP0458615.1 ATP-binding protein [Streptomyces montanisoli]
MNQESGTATRVALAHANHACFSRPFPTTRRGAHAVRHDAERWLADQLPSTAPDRDDLLAVAALLVGELTANAAVHGRVRGRRARLDVLLGPAELRIEVSDCRGDRLPVRSPDPCGAEGGESGRGLLLVEALADDWGVRPYPPSGKTVWAVCRRR